MLSLLTSDVIPLVPHHQVKEVFANQLFAGVLRCTQLHPSMSQRTRHEEAFIADQSENRIRLLISCGRSERAPPPTGICIPRCPGDGDAVSSVNIEGHHAGEEAGLLNWNGATETLLGRLEVSVEGAAVQLHQIQDGSSQILHHSLCSHKDTGLKRP